jgi:GxGYxY motif-containing protein
LGARSIKAAALALALVSASIGAQPARADDRLPGSRPPLLVANVGALSRDEQLVLTALQGIVNRTAPRVYLVGVAGGPDYPVDPSGELWLRDAIDYAVERVRDPYQLIRRFRAAVRGLVVWDPALAVDTQNVATTMAGLQDLLPVSPKLAAALSRSPYNIPLVADLRERGFASRAEAYD